MNILSRNPKGNGLIFWLIFALINWAIVWMLKKLIIADDFVLVGMLTLLSYVGLCTFGIAIFYTKKDKKVVAGAWLVLAFILNGIYTLVCTILVFVLDDYRLIGLTAMSVLITLIDPFFAAMIAHEWRKNHPVPAQKDAPAEEDEPFAVPEDGDGVHGFSLLMKLDPFEMLVLSRLGQAIWMLARIQYVVIELAKKNGLPEIDLEVEAAFPSPKKAQPEAGAEEQVKE